MGFSDLLRDFKTFIKMKKLTRVYNFASRITVQIKAVHIHMNIWTTESFCP